jgi:glycosyltransferase involved in cell wall biosynthesis
MAPARDLPAAASAAQAATPAPATQLRLMLTAYPLLPVSAESCGGAEQVLATLEAELCGRGHEPMVAACEGSRATGSVLPTGAAPQELDRIAEREEEHARHILQYLAGIRSSGAPDFHLIHDHSGGFWRHAAGLHLPVLATLHLPREFYGDDLLCRQSPNVFFNCVSEAQRAKFADVPQVMGTVKNGVRIPLFPLVERKQDFVLWMGRLCEEKGAHVALRVAQAAGMRLVMGGALYPFTYHHQYFEREVRPHLNSPEVEWVERPRLRQKLELLSRARALLVPSLVEETSSMVAMEAMACGTPVVAFRRGALPEVIVDGVTGFLVSSEEEMAAALREAGRLAPRSCRLHAETNLSSEQMADGYLALYRQVLGRFGERG